MKYLIPFLIVLLPLPTLGGIIGESTIGAFSLSIENRVFGDLDTADSTGITDSIRVYLAVTTAAHNVGCAIYKWSDTSMVDTSEIKSVGVGTGWIVFDLLLDGQIMADTQYIIVAKGESVGGDVEMYFLITGDAYVLDAVEVYGVWPSNLAGLATTGSRSASIYAWYTVPAVGPVGAVHSIDGSGVHHSILGSSVLHGP